MHYNTKWGYHRDAPESIMMAEPHPSSSQPPRVPSTQTHNALPREYHLHDFFYNEMLASILRNEFFHQMALFVHEREIYSTWLGKYPNPNKLSFNGDMVDLMYNIQLTNLSFTTQSVSQYVVCRDVMASKAVSFLLLIIFLLICT